MPSSKKMTEIEGTRYGRVLVCGSFEANGASGPINKTGDHFLATWGGSAGRYVVRIPMLFQACETISITLQLAAATDLTATVNVGVTDSTVGYPTVLVIQLLDGAGAGADMAAGANNRIHFSGIFINAANRAA